MQKPTISQIYGISLEVYKENLFKMLAPMLIPTIFIVGVALIFNLRALPSFEIKDISQYYSFSSYQALERILGTWYEIFLVSIIAYVIFVLYAVCTTSGLISDGLRRGSISFDVGGRKGATGFAFSLIPFALVMLMTYYLASQYGKYYVIIPFLLGYLWNYTIASSVVDGALIGKNMAVSMREVLRHPFFSAIIYVVPLAMVLAPTGGALYLCINYFPSYLFIITPIVIFLFIPYAVIVNTIGYLSLKL